VGDEVGFATVVEWGAAGELLLLGEDEVFKGLAGDPPSSNLATSDLEMGR
jgi:hypothetical protein